MATKTRRIFPQKYADILRALYHLNKNQRTAVLQKADTKLLRYIIECAINILGGRVSITKNHKARLRRHAPTLRKLANPSENFINKKKIIVQRGGNFLPALLAPLITTVLANLIANNGAR